MYELYSQNGHSSSSNSQDVLIKVQGVSKKFCRSLKRSLWYGVQDVARDLNPFRLSQPENPELRHDEFWAVNDVSFEVRRGECLGLIGRNGAGKTTLLKMLNGLIKPDKGRIEIRGQVGALIALGAGFNPILTGRENIYVNGAVLGLRKKQIEEKIEDIIDFAEIREFIDSPVQNYSSGMQIRLGFAVASALEPSVLLIDEVLAVGDIAFQAKCFNVLSDLRRKGAAFVFVSHNMHHIARYCDRVLYFSQGQIQNSGDTDASIEAFVRDTNATGQLEETGKVDFKRIFGSGKMAITGARFLDTEGNEIAEITSGEPVVLKIDYTCFTGSITEPLVDVLIRDRDGIFFQATNLQNGFNLGTLRNRGHIQIAFAPLWLSSQRLFFTIAIMDPQTKELIDWKRNIPLWVRGNHITQGRVHLDCDWQTSESVD
jgi:lipopolysaccharide transport system ATP-binding protein